MKAKYIVFALVLASLLTLAPKSNAQIMGPSEEQAKKAILAQIKILQQQLAQLVAKYNVMGGSLSGPHILVVGMSGNEVKDLQAFLAEDKEVYPEGLVTGYFGPLTEKALKKFQMHFIGGVPSGQLDTITDETIKAWKAAKIKEMIGGAFSSADEKDLKDNPGGKKKIICHVPPGNPANAHTIMIGEPALSAHLAKGSYLGECKSSNSHEDDEDDEDSEDDNDEHDDE